MSKIEARTDGRNAYILTYLSLCLASMKATKLTHISLASFLRDIGKQYSPRCDAAERGVPSGAILFAYRIFIDLKITPDAPKNESGLTQMIMMGKFIRHI